MDAHPDLFGYQGITRNSHPSEIFTRMSMLTTVDRALALGYLYGYPSHAVEFYSPILARGGVHGVPLVGVDIPTFKLQGSMSQFRYRQSPDHADNSEDRLIKSRAAAILAEYRVRRARYIGAGKPGVLQLIRDWYSDGQGKCAPSNVMVETGALR